VSADAPAEEGEQQEQLLARDRDPLKETEGREELSALEKAIGELPEDLKNPLILTALEGYSQAEAAELLGISQKAVETKVYRARKLLLEKMSRKGF
jgi:RNA polymerase sigma-70 factor (ECF subfamily)